MAYHCYAGDLMNYCTISEAAEASFIEKRSEFIGYIAPVKTNDEAVEFINSIKARHRKARHNVYAYILRQDNISRYSDDGEPQGTGGVPVLNVLQKRGLTDVCVVVTRYFGGILLGGGGLVRAYSHTAKIALDAGGIITMALCKIVKVQADYNFYGRLVPLICEEGGIVEDTQFTDNVEVTFRIPQDKVPFFESRLVDVSCGKFHSEVIDERYCEI